MALLTANNGVFLISGLGFQSALRQAKPSILREKVSQRTSLCIACALRVHCSWSGAVFFSFLCYRVPTAILFFCGRLATTRQSPRFASGVCDISVCRSDPSRRVGEGDGWKMQLLSAWNTEMLESNVTCTGQQERHPLLMHFLKPRSADWSLQLCNLIYERSGRSLPAQQLFHLMINFRSDPNASVRGTNS